MKSNKRHPKIILGALVALVISASSVQAIPALQVYIPGATYDEATETWITGESDFTVWIVASRPMYDISLTATLGEGEDPSAGSIEIDGTTYTGGDFTNGTHSVLPPHGIFPGNYVDHSIGDLTAMTDMITDFNEEYEEEYGEEWECEEGDDDDDDDHDGHNHDGRHGHGHGDDDDCMYGTIAMIDISIDGFTDVHFDAWGWEGQERLKFAPFSHDGGTGIPEPTTALLFALGAAGLGATRFRRKKKDIEA